MILKASNLIEWENLNNVRFRAMLNLAYLSREGPVRELFFCHEMVEGNPESEKSIYADDLLSASCSRAQNNETDGKPFEIYGGLEAL